MLKHFAAISCLSMGVATVSPVLAADLFEQLDLLPSVIYCTVARSAGDDFPLVRPFYLSGTQLEKQQIETIFFEPIPRVESGQGANEMNRLVFEARSETLQAVVLPVGFSSLDCLVGATFKSLAASNQLRYFQKN